MIAKIEVMMDDIWDLPPMLALSLVRGIHLSAERPCLRLYVRLHIPTPGD